METKFRSKICLCLCSLLIFTSGCSRQPQKTALVDLEEFQQAEASFPKTADLQSDSLEEEYPEASDTESVTQSNAILHVWNEDGRICSLLKNYASYSTSAGSAYITVDAASRSVEDISVYLGSAADYNGLFYDMRQSADLNHAVLTHLNSGMMDAGLSASYRQLDGQQLQGFLEQIEASINRGYPCILKLKESYPELGEFSVYMPVVGFVKEFDEVTGIFIYRWKTSEIEEHSIDEISSLMEWTNEACCLANPVLMESAQYDFPEHPYQQSLSTGVSPTISDQDTESELTYVYGQGRISRTASVLDGWTGGSLETTSLSPKQKSALIAVWSILYSTIRTDLSLQDLADELNLMNADPEIADLSRVLNAHLPDPGYQTGYIYKMEWFLDGSRQNGGLDVLMNNIQNGYPLIWKLDYSRISNQTSGIGYGVVLGFEMNFVTLTHIYLYDCLSNSILLVGIEECKEALSSANDSSYLY